MNDLRHICCPFPGSDSMAVNAQVVERCGKTMAGRCFALAFVCLQSNGFVAPRVFPSEHTRALMAGIRQIEIHLNGILLIESSRLLHVAVEKSDETHPAPLACQIHPLRCALKVKKIRWSIIVNVFMGLCKATGLSYCIWHFATLHRWLRDLLNTRYYIAFSSDIYPHNSKIASSIWENTMCRMAQKMYSPH